MEALSLLKEETAKYDLILLDHHMPHMDGVEVGQFTSPTDIVSLSPAASFHYFPNGPAVVFDIQPIPHILAFTVDRQGFVIQCIENHQRNQFFRELVGTIIIGAIGNGYRKTVSFTVGPDQMIGSGL